MKISRYYTVGVIFVQCWIFYIILKFGPQHSTIGYRPDNVIQYDISNRRSSLALSSEKNLIIGAAIALPLNTVLPFVRSARATCGFCMIALFINKHEFEDRNFVEMGYIYDVTWLIYEQFDISENYPEPGYLIRKIRWSLFSAYFGYLEQQNIEIYNVFITDVDDVLFQTNVFQHIQIHNGGIYVFGEHPPLQLGAANKYRKAIISCFGVEVVEQLNYRPSFSSGTILGSWEAIKFYTISMYSLIVNYEKETCTAYQFDNHFHYYVFYVTDLSNRTAVFHIPHENGFISTKADPLNTARNSLDLVINANGSVYAVIHSADSTNKNIDANKINPLLAKKNNFDE